MVLLRIYPVKFKEMKIYFLLFATITFVTAHSQRLNADLYAGISNYQGDLQGRFTFDNAHVAGGIGLSYDVTPHWIIHTGFMMTKLSGSDQTNPNAVGVDFRNLNFETSLKELHLALEYNLFDMQERSLTPYAFAGVAVMKYDPYTRVDGTRIFLKPLGTEGQGIPQYPEKKEYSLTQFAIPFGGGFKLALNPNLQIGLEVGLRKLFTDYLDDVSGNYADSALLSNFRGPFAVELAYRGDELLHGPGYPAAGSQRGNPKLKDWYYITCIRLRYLLNNNGENGTSRKSKVGCPVNVF